MRDPDLVQRAEGAANALEQAWMDWRERHGLGAGPLSPVSSYVGYSLEEPWGQPRVVLGIDAAEAELLATILEGHHYVGPVYAGVTSRQERRLANVPDAITGWGVPDGRPGISLRQPQPMAAAPVPAQPDATMHEAVGLDATGGDQAVPEYAVAASAPSAADLASRDQGTSELTEPAPPSAERADQPPEAAAQLEELAARPAVAPTRAPLSRAYPSAPILPVSGGGTAAAAALPSAGQPGIVSLRQRTTARPAKDQRPALPEQPAARSNGQDRPSPADQPADQESPDQAQPDQVSKGRLQPVPKLNRPRRSGPAKPAARTTPGADQPRAATDTAV
jgi:hypothetical protein